VTHYPVVWLGSGAIYRIDELLAGAGVSLEGFKLGSPVAVSRNGRMVVGNGVTPAGHRQAWLADLTGTALFPDAPNVNGKDSSH
jgi:hypothetical protein